MRLTLALASKIGVPVKPNSCAFGKNSRMAWWLSPNWLRWHSSKMITACPANTWCPLFDLMNVDSFWIVVMMIRALGSSSCFFRIAVDAFEFAAPFSNRSYSRIV